jgi:hypothetical protein
MTDVAAEVRDKDGKAFGERLASGNAKILVSGQLSPGSRTPEFLVRGQVTSVATL